MTVVVAFISDRNDRYIHGCVESFCTYAPHVEASTVIDDSAHLLGMAGAAKAAWQWALDQNADYLFHVEEDFLFTAPVPVDGMVRVLDMNPHLAQVVLKRQPWSRQEKEAGGQIETNPEAYTQRSAAGEYWIEHWTLFSMNPCLIPRRTLELAWNAQHPDGVEKAVTEACIAARMHYAYFGKLEDPARCEHIGRVRAEEGWRW